MGVSIYLGLICGKKISTFYLLDFLIVFCWLSYFALLPLHFINYSLKTNVENYNFYYIIITNWIKNNQS